MAAAPDPYFKNKEHDGMSFDKDTEFLANMAARNWVIGSLDSSDYASPGKQTKSSCKIHY